MKAYKELGPIIGGREIKTQNSFFDKNPANGEIIAEIGSCSIEDVEHAVKSGGEAFQSWGATSREYRADCLYKMAEIIESDMDTFARNETLCTGKCLQESYIQLDLCAKLYKYFAAAIASSEDTLVQHSSGSFSAIVREPLGVVGLILPWNAPVMLMAWKLAPALAAGNCAVVKTATLASASVLELAGRFQAVLPPGVLNVVTGSGSTAGNALISHPDISKVSFTGSTDVGRSIGKICGENITPCTLELGGKSANIIFADAQLDRAVQFAMIGTLSSAGAVCVAGTRLLIQDEIYDSFLKMLKEKFEPVRVGDPMEDGVQMGPVIDEVQFETIMKYIEHGKSEGAKLVCGGTRLTGGQYDKGFYVAPTIFEAENSMKISQEEIFGPVINVIRFSTEEEAISIANDSCYGLGAGLWTKDIHRAIRVSRKLEAGTVWVNDYLDSSPGNPFGGYKNSGIGREVHKMALENYTRVKNICVSNSEDVPPVY